MTAASLAGVQATCRGVIYHFPGWRASSGNGLTKGVAFVAIVLKRRNALTEMVLKRGED